MHLKYHQTKEEKAKHYYQSLKLSTIILMKQNKPIILLSEWQVHKFKKV